MDAGSVLCSCQTAFAMKYLRAAMQAEMGLKPQQALEISAQVLQGAATLI